METIYCEKLPRILKNKKRLERILDVKITNKNQDVEINGSAENEYIAEKVIDALNLGFPLSVAFLIKTKDFMLETINIKDHTKRKDLARIRARIIGKQGKTLKTLSDLTNCFFEMAENKVGIVGAPELIKNAQDAIIQIIQGSKQSNVYSYLEKHQIKPVIDLGLKNNKR